MRTLIIANWKCNPINQKEAERLFNSVKDGLKNIKNTEVVICPPFLYVSNLKSRISNLKLGGQDCFWEKSGAFTGGISPNQLFDIGCQYVILGHSERRIHLGETDEIINKKIKAAISAKLKPIFCIGETLKEKESGRTRDILKLQIEKGLFGISEEEIKNITIAYEPVWAIGTGNSCSLDEIQKAILFIREIISKLYPNIIIDNLRVLYGGSVNSENVGSYFNNSGVNGFLVGGASLKSQEFIKIVEIVNQAKL